MEYEDFKRELMNVDKQKAAQELLWWLTEKIVSYIDNHQTSYTLSFLADREKMPELSKVEDLGYSLTTIELSADDAADFDKEIEENEDVKREGKMIKLMNSFMKDVRELALEDKEAMEKFFRALLYYYSTVAFYKGKPISKDMGGYIDLQYFSFENMSMQITKVPLIPVKNDKGEIIDYKRDSSKKEIVGEMPPAFAVDFEIVFWEKKEEVSLF